MASTAVESFKVPAMPDVQVLLAETAVMPPTGTDLEYDAGYVEFEALVGEKPERQFQSAPEEPPWRDILERAVDLLGKSKDLRVAIAYMRAAAHVHGIAGFLAGLRLLHGLLERYWESLYPRLDAEENNDAALRINALAALADAYSPFAERTTLLHDLRLAEVSRTTSGLLRVRDILIAQHKYAAAEGEAPPLTLQQVQGLLGEARDECPGVLDEGLALPGAVEALAHRMTECFGASDAPGMTSMMSVAQSVAEACRAVAGDAPPQVAAAAAMDTLAPASGHAPPRAEGAQGGAGSLGTTQGSPALHGLGQLATRQDAIALLEAVCIFIERTEPTNPAPLLIRRAKALMDKDFIEIMQDLAPDGLAQVHLIAGTRRE
jgi:type VI secretion system protein ImpA